MIFLRRCQLIPWCVHMGNHSDHHLIRLLPFSVSGVLHQDIQLASVLSFSIHIRPLITRLQHPECSLLHYYPRGTFVTIGCHLNYRCRTRLLTRAPYRRTSSSLRALLYLATARQSFSMVLLTGPLAYPNVQFLVVGLLGVHLPRSLNMSFLHPATPVSQ